VRSCLDAMPCRTQHAHRAGKATSLPDAAWCSQFCSPSICRLRVFVRPLSANVQEHRTFPLELQAWTPAELPAHVASHPACEFCHHRGHGSQPLRFYSSDELFQHMQREHFSCHVCLRRRGDFNYFPYAQPLISHLRSASGARVIRICTEQSSWYALTSAIPPFVLLKGPETAWHSVNGTDTLDMRSQSELTIVRRFGC